MCALILTILGWQMSIRTRTKPRTAVYDAALSPQVSTYLSEHVRGVMSNDGYDSYGNLLTGQTGNYCDARIYGYDEQYIYAHATCQEYGWFYHYNTLLDDKNTIRITRSAQRGTGWSSPVRLSYDKTRTDFNITGYEQPRDGSLYVEDIKRLFAPMGEINYFADRGVSDRLLRQFRDEHGDDPYPDKIDRIYASRNPKIIIGVEVE